MSETIQTALITFASGALGSVVGAISAYVVAKHAAKGQLRQIIVQENYAARLAAFQSLLEAHTSLISGNYAPDLIAAFISAANRASLVASPAAIVEITLFRESTLDRTENRMSAVVSAMQKDLSVFIEPDILKNHWNKKQPSPRQL